MPNIADVFARRLLSLQRGSMSPRSTAVVLGGSRGPVAVVWAVDWAPTKK